MMVENSLVRLSILSLICCLASSRLDEMGRAALGLDFAGVKNAKNVFYFR